MAGDSTQNIGKVPSVRDVYLLFHRPVDIAAYQRERPNCPAFYTLPLYSWRGEVHHTIGRSRIVYLWITLRLGDNTKRIESRRRSDARGKFRVFSGASPELDSPKRDAPKTFHENVRVAIVIAYPVYVPIEIVGTV